MLSVSLNPYPQASACVPILRICLRVSTQQYSQSNTVLIIFVPLFLVLTRGSPRKQVKQVIANIQSSLHGYHHRETIDITYASEFQNLLMILYPHDKAKRNSCRLWRD